MKKYFITGLIILLPVLLTFFLFVFLIDFFTEPFLGFVEHFLMRFQSDHHPLFSKDAIGIFARIIIFILLCIFILILGFIARWLFFRELLDFTNNLFTKIPFVKGIYQVCKDLSKAIFSTNQREAFKHTSLVHFPSKYSTAIGFVTGSVPSSCEEKIKNGYTPVLILTAPHPISGFLIFVPNEEVYKIDMTNEEALKFLISCGLILPEDRRPHNENKP